MKIQNYGGKDKLDNKNKEFGKIEKSYWRISKLISILFLIVKHQLWTEPYSFIKAVLLLVGVAVGAFVVINLLDLAVGMIFGIIKHICKKIKDRRLLKRMHNTTNINDDDKYMDDEYMDMEE